MWETWVLFLGWEDPLEEGMATHFSILAWRIPWTEPGGLQSMGSQSQTRLSTAQMHVHSSPMTSMQIVPKFSFYHYVNMTMLEPLENWVTVKTEPERYVHIWIPWTCEYYFTMVNTQVFILSYPVVAVQLLSRVWLFATPKTAACQAPLTPVSPGVCSNSCPLSLWCSLTISSSAAAFSSCPQSLPASGSFPVSQLFTSGGQSIEASASVSVLPVNIHGWFLLGLSGLILQSKELSRVFSNTTIQKHQFFGVQPSL